MSIVTDPENFEYMKNKVSSLLSFRSSHYSNSFLSRRVDVRLRATNTPSYMEYCNLLDNNVEERDRLYKELTINVTHFFRDIEMWEIFKNEVIPLVISLKKETGSKSIRVWSAGSSSGEEALSIVICFYETLGSAIGSIDLQVIGTDLNRSIIESAKTGLYEEQQFSEMKPELQKKYFKKVDHDIYEARKDLVEKIDYRYGDILGGRPEKKMDIIFCRNTVIYFNAEAKPKLYHDFYEALNSGGFFIMGKTEGLLGETREMFQVFNSRERIYFKE